VLVVLRNVTTGLKLFNNLYRGFGALDLACPTHETFVNFDRNRLLVFDFIDSYRARVNACSASGAFSVIHYDLHHFGFLPILEFHEELSGGIKIFRCSY